MRDLVGRDLAGVARHRRIGEGHLAAAGDRALRAGARQQIGGEARAVDGVGIELGLEIFEVQREVQDVGVADRRLRFGRRRKSHRRETGACHGRGAERLQERAPLLTPFRALLQRAEQLCLICHDVRAPCGLERDCKSTG